jgi:hypothetical protein
MNGSNLLFKNFINTLSKLKKKYFRHLYFYQYWDQTQGLIYARQVLYP